MQQLKITKNKGDFEKLYPQRPQILKFIFHAVCLKAYPQIREINHGICEKEYLQY